jgi:hypothetical protein
LPQVDREFYVMRGEIYTTQPFGTHGDQEMDYEKLVSERPEYFIFNGADQIPSIARRHGGDGPHLFWRRRPELHCVSESHRRDL